MIPTATFMEGDCLEQLKKIPDESVESCVTDPPYNLAFMSDKGVSWDAVGSPQGFQKWCAEWAKEVFRVLKPGGYLLSFGGARTFHRLTAGIEDAGFDIRDCFSWIYGTGFPSGNRDMGKALGSSFQGYGTRLKPAWEPAIMARKPFKGSLTAHVKTTGLGALNIDDNRIPIDEADVIDEGNYKGSTFSNRNPKATGRAYLLKKNSRSDEENDKISAQAQLDSIRRMNEMGRWPANVIFDEEAAKIMDQQSVGAARFFYQPKASKKERTVNGQVKNVHPTVKPVELMKHLISLVCPTETALGYVPTVLDPFAGSGSTALAAKDLGINSIMIEIDPTSMKIAKERFFAW
jgi:site-specific DNA-methyltransferase (adenine-specific)